MASWCTEKLTRESSDSFDSLERIFSRITVVTSASLVVTGASLVVTGALLVVTKKP